MVLHRKCEIKLMFTSILWSFIIITRALSLHRKTGSLGEVKSRTTSWVVRCCGWNVDHATAAEGERFSVVYVVASSTALQKTFKLRRCVRPFCRKAWSWMGDKKTNLCMEDYSCNFTIKIVVAEVFSTYWQRSVFYGLSSNGSSYFSSFTSLFTNAGFAASDSGVFREAFYVVTITAKGEGKYSAEEFSTFSQQTGPINYGGYGFNGAGCKTLSDIKWLAWRLYFYNCSCSS